MSIHSVITELIFLILGQNVSVVPHEKEEDGIEE